MRLSRVTAGAGANGHRRSEIGSRRSRWYSAAAEVVDGERTGPQNDEDEETRDIQEVDFVTRRPKQRSGRAETDGVNRTKAITEMDRDHGDDHRDHQRDTDEGDERADDERETASQFENRDRPGGDRRKGYSDLIE